IVALIAELEARRREVLARYDEQRPANLLKAQIIREELTFVDQSLAEARQRRRELTIRAGADGTFVLPVPPVGPCPCSQDLLGRFVNKGDLVGYVVELGTVTVRVIIPQGQIDLVQQETRALQVRLSERLHDPLPGRIRRILPGATDQLPTTALGSEGGGQAAVDPRDTRGITAI